MSLWYAQRGRRANDTGKFRSQARFGTEKTSGGQHRGWSYYFVSHRTGASISRTTYNVTILGPHQNRAAYLQDFSSVQQAAAAARDWIDQALDPQAPEIAHSSLGTIPARPDLTGQT